MKTATAKEQAVDVQIDIVAELRAAADQWDELPAWRRRLATYISGRNWGVALRGWAEIELRQRIADKRDDK